LTLPIAQRSDPYLQFRFVVEIDGVIVGGFSEVGGLQVEIETEDYREGGRNEFIHKLPKGASYPLLSLKRGITDSNVLWKWQEAIIRGRIDRKTVHVILLDSEGNHGAEWRFRRAYPVRWTGSELRAEGVEVAIETLELAHEGIERD